MTKEMRIFAAQANEERSVTMARPIKETPILYGKDAKRFLKGETACTSRIRKDEEDSFFCYINMQAYAFGQVGRNKAIRLW